MIPEPVMSDPIIWLRVTNAAFALPFMFVCLWVYWKSKHHSNLIYRLGMLCLTVGLVMVAGFIKTNAETWLFKNVGIYLSLAAIAFDFIRGKGNT